ncbi:MAG: FAD-dependent monooxygenase [Candidatus Binatus sp.]
MNQVSSTKSDGGRFQAIIVGAGPAGAALSYLLARRGIDIVLLERQTDFAREFRGEGLLPTGIDAIEQMGLGAELNCLQQTVVRSVEFYILERGPIRIASNAGEDFGIRVISQPEMLEMLVAQAARYPSFRLERGATVRDLIYTGDRVTGVRIESPSGPHEFRGQIVIGADGRASVLRKRAGLHEERFPQYFDLVWGKIPLPQFMDRSTVRAYLGRNHAAVAFAAADGRLQIGWSIEKGAFGDLWSRGVEEWFAEMTEFLSPDLSAHIRANLGAVSHPFLLNVVCDRLVRWTAPGLLLLGDAAHPMSPVGAQGINMALRDALVAANHLCPVLGQRAEPDSVDAAASRVQAERLLEIEVIQRVQDTLPRILFGTVWWGKALRALALPIMSRPALAKLAFSGLRAASGRLRARFDYGVTEVRLDVQS